MARKAKDYSQTKIYKFRVNGKEYYGHTTQRLCARKSSHVRDFKAYPNRKVFKAIREAGLHMKDIELILVENYPCNSEEEAVAREKYWIKKNGDLNTRVPSRGNKEYYEDNKPIIRKKQKAFYLKHRVRILQQHKQYRKSDVEKQRDINKRKYLKRRTAYQSYFREYYIRNKAKRQAYNKAFMSIPENKEKERARCKAWREANKEMLKEKQQKYREENRDEILAKKRDWSKKQQQIVVHCPHCNLEMKKPSLRRHLKRQHPTAV